MEPALGQFMKLSVVVYYAFYNNYDIDFAEYVNSPNWKSFRYEITSLHPVGSAFILQEAASAYSRCHVPVD